MSETLPDIMKGKRVGRENFLLKETQELYRLNVVYGPYIDSNSMKSKLLCTHTIAEEVWTVTGYFMMSRIFGM